MNFKQPDAAAIALNRVTSPDASLIEGRINANGQVVLINQSGVVFAKGAQVNAQSLVVSTANISNKNFMAGNLAFDQAGKPGAKIVNNGAITVKQAGLAAFVAPQVANNGIITARLAHVVLAGAETFTLDLYGDQLISLDVTSAVRPVDFAGRKVAALVTNHGVIIADGGSIKLTAREADGLIQRLLNVGGTLRADSVGQSKGQITIDGVGGDIQIAGNLLARGPAPGSSGGTIGIDATGNVSVAKSARINASGAAGGGVVAVGTSIQRAVQGAVDTTAPRAAKVSIAQGAMINADATGSGNGGTITLLSAQRTDQGGALSAQGAGSGNGGMIETSSDGVISLSGTESVFADHGQSGEILLDPATLVVTAGNPQANPIGNTTFGSFNGPPNSSSNIAPSVLGGLSGNVVLKAANVIDVASAVSNTLGANFTLQSQGEVTIGANISLGGSLEIDAGSSIVINASVNAGGDLSMTAGQTVPGGGITEQSAGIINTPLLSLASDGSVLLGNVGNAISSLTGASLNNGNFTLQDATALSVTNTIAANNISLIDSAAGGLQFGAGAGSTATAGVLSVGTGGGVALIANNLGSLVSGNTIIAPSGTIALAPFTPGDAIEIGTAATSGLAISPGFLASLDTTANELAIGGFSSFVAGALNIDTALTSFANLAFTGSSLVTDHASLSATDINVTGGGIAFDAAVNAANALSLSSHGGVSQTAAITAGTLAGTLSTGTLALTNSANAITDLGNITIAGGDLALADKHALTVQGAVSAQNIALTDQTSLGIGDAVKQGTLAAGTSGAVDLVADAIGVGNAGSTIIAPSGTIAFAPYTSGAALEIGNALLFNGLELATPLLASLDTSANLLAFGSVGSFEAGSINIDSAPPSVQNIAFIGTGGVTDNAGLLATNVTLEGSSLALDDTIDAAGTLDLLSAGGASQTAPFAAAVLAGSLGTNTTLANTLNSVSELGNITATGAFDLFDNAALNIAGAVSVGTSLTLGGNAVSEASTGAVVAGLFTGSHSATVDLSNGSNNIADLSNITITGGDFRLDDAQALGVLGSVSADNITLAGANGLTLGGATLAGLLSAGNAGAIDLAFDNFATGTAGGTISAPAGTIAVAPFAANGVLDVNVALAGLLGTSANVLVFGTASGHEAGSLTIASALASFASLSFVSSGGITDQASIGAQTIAFNGTSLSLGPIDAISLLDLVAGNGGVSQTSAVTAGTLIGSAGTGGVALTDSLNAIGTLAGFTVTNGAFDLTDSGSLALAGPLAASNASLSAASLGITGSLIIGNDLAFGGGGVSEAGAGVINTGTLSGGASATVDLSGGTNSITNLGNFVVSSGNLLIADQPLLHIIGTARAATIGLSLAAGAVETTLGALDASLLESIGNFAGNAVLQAGANSISTLGNFIVNGGSLQFADMTPVTLAGTVSASNISLTDASTIGSDILFAGQVSTGTLNLDSANGVAQSTGSAIDVSLLTGSVGNGLVDLTEGLNTMISIGSFDVPNGDFNLSTSSGLLVSGALSASNIGLTAQSITIGGTLSAPNIVEFSSANGVSETRVGVIDAGTLTNGLAGITGNVLLGNSVNNIAHLGPLSLTNGDLQLSDNAPLSLVNIISARNISLADSGVLTLDGTLNAAPSAAVNLLANGFAVGAGGTILTSGGTVSIGAFTASDMIDVGGTALSAGTLDIATGLLGAISSNVADLVIGSAAGGAINMTGPVTFAAQTIALVGAGVMIGNTLVAPGVLDIQSSAGIGQTATGVIAANTLVGSAKSAIALTDPQNSIAVIGSLSTPGDFALTDSASLAVNGKLTGAALAMIDSNAAGLAVNGTLSAGASGAVTINSDALSAGAAGVVQGNIVTLAPFTGTNAVVLAGAAANELNIGQAFLSAIGTNAATLDIGTSIGSLDVAGPVSVATQNLLLSGAAINFAGNLTAADHLTLASAAAITQISGSITATDLQSGALLGGPVSLTDANAIGTLGNFAVTGGDFALTDGGSLSVIGTVRANDITFSAGNLALQSGSIGTGTLALYSGGTINQTGGTISANILTSDGQTEQGDVSLGGANNNINTLGPFAALGNITLADASPLAIAGTVATGQTLALADLGGISETTGVIDVGQLTSDGMAIGGGVTFGNANSINTLGGFTLNSGLFDLNNNAAIDVAGTVNVPVMTLTAPNIAISGQVTALNTLVLGSAGPINETGGITTVYLSDNGTPIGGAVNLTGGNEIATLGNFAVTTTGVNLTDNQNLSVQGTVSGPSVDLAASSLSIAAAGVVTANTATLAATGISGGLGIGGFVDATTNLALASKGGIGESGSITTQLLTSAGSISGGPVNLTGSNQIATLGSFTAGQALDIIDGSALSLVGDVTAPSATLAGVGLAFSAGSISTGTLALGSSAGISQSGGVIDASILVDTGNAITGPVALTGSNSIANIGNFAGNGDVSLNDGSALSIIGTLGAANTLNLAGSGPISENGGVIAATLLTSGSGPIGGAVVLNGANQIGTLGAFAVSTGSLVVNDSGALDMAGAVSGPAVSLSAAGLAINNLVSAAGEILLSSAGTLAIGNAGIVEANTLALASSAGITETGSIVAALLTSNNNPIAGAIALTGSNNITDIGNFDATSSLALNDLTALTFSGPVNAADMAVNAAGITVDHLVSASNSVSLNSTGSLDVAAGGTIDAPQVTLAATGTTAGIGIEGLVSASSGLVLASNDGVSESGSIDTANLSSSGAITGNAALTGNNQIATLGHFGATGGDLSIDDVSFLTIAGAVNAPNASFTADGLAISGSITANGTVELGSQAGITESGGISALHLASNGAVKGNVDLTGINHLGNIDNFTLSNGDFNVTNAQLLGIDGAVSANNISIATQGLALTGAINTGNLVIGSDGEIAQAAASNVTATQLSSNGVINGVTDLLGRNHIATLGNMAVVNGQFALNDLAGLVVNGVLSDPGNIVLNDSTTIIQTGGSISTATLSGSAGTLAKFDLANQIGTLGSFILQDSTFILNDARDLTITGPVVANQVSITSVGQMVLDGVPGGGLFITGTIAPINQILPTAQDSVLKVINGDVQNLVQTGVFNINTGSSLAQAQAAIGAPATIFVTLTPNGRARFADLNGPSVEMVLGLGSGTASGLLNLNRLGVIGGAQGQVNFTGTLGNIPGQAAAHNGSVFPFPQPNYQFNACPLGSVNCTILPIETVPPGNPLESFNLSPSRRKKLDHDVQLPGIATRDF
ncbi:MAG: hypothetical protein B7Z78_00590 [Rhodospirillales bacterium 20-60-12]|nr:MAG: hypothetical protein B7Z78_00590 [Rhodospirillales bacterium 20-60-12]